MAAHIGVSKARMSQMVSGGVPRDYLIAVRDFTQGEVSLESLLTKAPAKCTKSVVHA